MNEVSTEKWYTSKEMCEMNSVSEITLKRFNEELTGIIDDTTQLIKKGGYHNSQNFYSEEALKQFQLWLLKNQANQGRASDVVKQNTENLLEVGALTTCVQNNGDIEAAQQFCNLLMANTAAVAESKKLALENARQQTQLIEQKPKVDYYNDFCNSDGYINIGLLGKITSIGAKNIFKKLSEDKIIFRVVDSSLHGISHYEPYYAHKKYFHLQPQTVTTDNNNYPTFKLQLTIEGFIKYSQKYGNGISKNNCMEFLENEKEVSCE